MSNDTFSLDGDAIQMVKANLVPLVAPTSVPQPNTAGQYDLLPFLRGGGEAYLTKNNWASDEIMWSEAGKGSVWYQRKNAHSEEFGLTVTHIVRGLDDSPGAGEAYILSNEDGSQGSPWSPRWMKPGETFKRVAVVKFYDLETGARRKSFIHVTWLKFIKYHTSWVSPYGLIVPHVAEFEAYVDNNGSPGAVFERYRYALDLGLVGWNGGPALSLVSGIAARLPGLAKFPRMKLNWYGGLQLLMTTEINFPSQNDPRWQDAEVRMKAAEGAVNLRKNPFATTNVPVVGKLSPGTVYSGQAIKGAYAGTDGNWYAVDIPVNAVPIKAWVREDVVTVDFAAAPVLTPVERDEALAIIADLKTSYQAAYARLTAFEEKLLEGGQ